MEVVTGVIQIQLGPVGTDLFSANFPRAQMNIVHLDGKFISDSLTKVFVWKELQKRLGGWSGMHRCFMVKAQMGKGKTTWVHDTVRPVMKWYNERWNLNDKVLFLCNRNALSTQQINEAERFTNPYCTASVVQHNCSDYEVGGIRLMTYHHYYKLYKKYGQEYFSSFRIVVADEVHFFVADAEFNPDTYEILKSIPVVFFSALRIYMTATPEDVIDPIYYVEWMNTKGKCAVDKCRARCDCNGDNLVDVENTLPKLDVYSFPYSYSFINSLGYFQPEKGILERIISNKPDEKWIVFVTGKKSGKELCDRLRNQKIKTLYLDGESRNSNDIDVRQAWERLLQEGRLTDVQVLICTKVLDNGFSITDPAVKHVVINTNNRTEFLQELGRVRVKEGQKINVYFTKMSKSYFRKRDDILYTFCKFYGSENIPECGGCVEIPMQRSSLITYLLHTDNAIGYLTTDTIQTEEGMAEKPRINDLVRWMAKRISDEEKRFNVLLRDKPDSASIEYKVSWLKVDDNRTFLIRNMDIPPDEESASRIDEFLGKYVNRKMKEFIGTSATDDDDEKLYEEFSTEFQKIYLECFPEKKNTVNTSKNRAPWKHDAINKRLKELNDRQRDNEHFKLSLNYEFVKEGGYWLLKGT